jgi:invasion protein IalB
MIVAMFVAAVLLADASAAAAPQAAAAPAEATASSKAKADKDELVCTYEETIGTRFRKKICSTRREADDRSRQDRDNLNRMQAATPAPRS